MGGKANKIKTRVKLALAQNRAAIVFVLGWLVANAVVFARVLGMSTAKAALVAVCMAKMSDGWPAAYQSFTEVVVFGLVASVVVANVTQRYRPESTCRALAAGLRDHVVVIGFSNLGQRVHDIVRDAKKGVVVVEQDAAKVASVIHDEEPLVVGNARDRDVLADAGVRWAKVVVIATDDLETAAVACRLVREANPSCELVVRCSDGDVARVLSKTYQARCISTSKLAALFIQGMAVKARVKSAVVLGDNDVAHHVAEAMAEKRIACNVAPVTEDVEALVAAGVPSTELVVVCDDDLGKNLIRVDRIRDLNARARVVCRAFHDDAAELLTRAPFSCTVISTSKHAAEMLVRAGAFRAVGIEEVTGAPGGLAAAKPDAAALRLGTTPA